MIKKKSSKEGHRNKKSASTKPTEEAVRTAVREHYGKLATSGGSCCGPQENTMCCSAIYPNADVISLPSEAIAVSAGCGNPTAIASLKEGMTVVDLGSGGGIDVFLSAKKVGPKGKVYGIDATPEMIMRARKTARENGYDNVDFRLGEIEHMPLERDTADVVISNCVINLSPDKEQVFREAYRVLKPGGRLAVSDIVLLKELPEAVRSDMEAWSECISGAVSEKEYIGAIKKAGFDRVKVEDRVLYTHEQLSGQIKTVAPEKAAEIEGVNLSKLVASYRISASKPKK